MRDRLAAAKLAVPFLFFLSGAAALVYESLWMRQFGLIFGNTTYSVTVTLATFMGGIALGSHLIATRPVRNPARLYALAEAAAGLAALATLVLLRRLPHWYGALQQAAPLPVPLELGLRVLLAALVIGPTTVLLGMTFPLLAEFLSRAGRGMHASIGALYRVNTLGGAAGVLLAGFLLLPALGVTGLFLAAAGTNLAIGVAFWLLAPPPAASRPAASLSVVPATPPASASPAAAAPALFALLAFCSGAAAFGLEILCTRSLALTIGSSYYSFNTMLAAFLLGIVLGAAVYRAVRPQHPAPLLGALFAALGVLSLLEVWLLGRLPRLYYSLMTHLGSSFLGHQAAGFGLSLLAMLPLTTLFGITFPLLAHLQSGGAREVAGRLYLWNTLGSILGAMATGFLLIPLAGIQASFVWVAGLLLVPGVLALLVSLPKAGTLRATACLAAAALLAGAGFFYRPWDRLLMTSGIYKYGLEWRKVIPDGRTLQDSLRKYRSLLFYREGREGVVSVTRSDAGTFLAINGKIDAGNQADIVTQKLLAHVPLALHPDPRTVFIVGWGSGCTAGSASLYPVRAIHCAEIEPVVFDTSSLFEELNRGVQRDPRFTMHLRDARNVLLTSGARYDVIISEPSNPWVAGMSSLFTAEFYEIAARRLADDGVFCQWFHYYDLGLRDIRVQVATFCRQFPHVSLWLVPPVPAAEGGQATPIGDILLLGSLRPLPLDYRQAAAAFALPGIRDDLRGAGVEDELALLGTWAADREDLLAFAGEAPDNTDDRPFIEMNAPRGLYNAANTREQRLAMYQALDAVGRSPLPPIRNHPDLSAGPTGPAAASIYERLAELYEARLRSGRARRLREAAGRMP